MELARAAGIEVRALPQRGAGLREDAPARSGICRVRGATWVLLAAGDGLEEQIAVLAEALLAADPGLLEGHFLAPAVRQRIESARRGS